MSKVEQRRSQALAPVPSTDHLHALLLKHRDGELWPAQPAERDHFKRVLGLLPPFPHPAAPVGAAQAQAVGPSQAAQNGHAPNSGASPMLETWLVLQPQAVTSSWPGCRLIEPAMQHFL